MAFQDLFQSGLPAAYEKLCSMDEEKKNLSGTVVFHLLESDEEIWTVEVADGKMAVSDEKAEDADSLVIFKKGVFKKFISDDLNIPMALTFGKIKVKGSTSKLLAFKDILDHLD